MRSARIRKTLTTAPTSGLSRRTAHFGVRCYVDMAVAAPVTRTWRFGTAMTMTRRIKTLGAALIIIVGLLNFHIPHFLLERSTDSVPGASWLEFVFVAVVLGAMTAAVGIWCTRRWGWLLGVVVVVVALALYVTQESVGLPGMPRNWLEPSRIVSLIFDALFVAVARKHVASRRPDLAVADH